MIYDELIYSCTYTRMIYNEIDKKSVNMAVFMFFYSKCVEITRCVSVKYRYLRDVWSYCTASAAARGVRDLTIQVKSFS